MAAKKGYSFVMSNEHRVKIQNSNILKCLIEHAEGRREMGATQVSAGLGLLKKIMPDLAALTIQGDAENPLSIKVTIGGDDKHQPEN